MVLTRSAGRMAGPLQVAAIAAVTLAARALPTAPIPRLAMITPIAYFVSVLADASTAAVLFSLWRYSAAARSTLVLAFSFGASSLVLLMAMLALPLLPLDPPALPAPPQAGIWLYVCWHVTAAAGALIYIFYRQREFSKAPSRRFALQGLALPVSFVVACGTIAFGFGGYLPILVNGATLVGPLSSALGVVTIGLLAMSAIFAARIRNPSKIDRALAYSLLSLTLDMTLFFVSGHRYSPAFYAGRIFLFVGATIVLVSAVQTLISARARLSDVEWNLARVERQSAKRAARIRALWQIASQGAESNERRLTSILDVATAAVRAGKPMLGLLSHLDGEQNVIVDAASWMPPAPAGSAAARVLHPGATIAFERTIHNLVHRAARTMAWDDLSCLNDCGMLYEELGLRSFIGTPVTIARRTYFVSFVSPQPMSAEPFAEDDYAFVEVVASFFRSWFTQQMQFERIQFQIEHDALTGLENSVQFRKAVREEIPRGAFAVAYLDLDDFRHINEWEGHQTGDEILVAVARALSSVSEDHLVARLSGDEFGILLRGARSLESTVTALEAYGAVFAPPFRVAGSGLPRTLRVAASIGAARFPSHGSTPEELMNRAGVALGVAKARGGSTTVIFDEPMEAILEESHLRVVELSDAIAHDQLALVYQPTFDLATRAIVGAEALVRWDHPDLGRLPPAEFIPLAERNGMIGPLSRWVVRRVVSDLSRAQDLRPSFRVYFNLAAENLDDIPFITELNASLRARPDLLGHIGIEVTETAAMQNVERSMQTIEILRGMGVSVAIDDFGTGYSSLSYLKRLTVDMIKIDRSFVSGLPDDERDCALTEMLLRITDRFGFTTLAEGIETEAQASWLLEHGCSFGQGYLIAKPRPFEELLRMLAAERAVLGAIS